MCVHLATETLSDSVADAIQCCQTKLKLPGHSNTYGTCKFILTFNNLFDWTDSKNPNKHGSYKAPMKVSNKDAWLEDFRLGEMFIRNLRHTNPEVEVEINNNDSSEPPMKKVKKLPEYVVNGLRKRGFLAFLINIQSYKLLFETYVEKLQVLDYILGHKLSQDRLELFLGAIRSSLGNNNNPTVRQFLSSYRKLVIGATHFGNFENCKVQDETYMPLPEETDHSVNFFIAE